MAAAAARPQIGSVGEFDPKKEDFYTYEMRLKIWMSVNKIDDDDKGKVLLALVGPEAFEIIMNQTAPDDPSTKPYADLVKIAKDYYDVTKNALTERQEFRARQQTPGEGISDYILALKRLSRHCNYGDQLNENLRDTFVGGLSSKQIKQKLFLIKDLTWAKAQSEALAMEAANRDAQTAATGGEQQTINKVSGMKKFFKPKKMEQNKDSNNNCNRCTGKHPEHKCPHKQSRCFKCNRYGHIATACHSRSQKNNQYQKRQQHMVTTGEETEEQEGGLYNLFAIGAKAAPPYTEVVNVNGKNLSFMVDTAAAATVISDKLYRRHFASEVSLKPCYTSLFGFTGQKVPVVGKILVKVQYEGQCKQLPIIVVEGDKQSLLGRDWMLEIKLNWSKILHSNRVNAVNVKGQNSHSQVDNIVQKHLKVFETQVKLSQINNFTADVKLEKGSEPIFRKARPVPYSLLQKVESELGRLEKNGVIKKVKTSKWASPIVVAPKTDGNIRICGDYKSTVNTCVEDRTYPLPTADDIYAKLANGKYFSKIDLSSAYLQLALTEESKDKFTINTPKGLYQYERLPFGVSTAPSIFQSVMDQVLQGLNGVCCFLDDILRSTDSLENHVAVLDSVLQRLQNHNILAKKSKCEFAVKEVVYLGHRINASGLQPTEEKIQVITSAKIPSNVSELRTFLGIVSYYQKFIPNLANRCAPLYKLLHKDTKWRWSDECEKAVSELKEALTSDTLLVHYDPNKPLLLATDASPVGVGCVILHIMEDGNERPIAYASRSLTSSERNYPQIEHEALGIVHGVKRFHKYLYGREFTLITDNQPLSRIFAENKEIPTLAALRLQRWGLILSAY